MEKSILENILNIKIHNIDIFEEALTHKSYSYENSGKKIPSYERLEFLGDSILSFIVGDFLLKKYPKANEGELSRFRSKVVQASALDYVARKIGISPYILVGKSFTENKRVDLPNDDVYEALVAAIYIDQGLEATLSFVNRTLLSNIHLIPVNRDYKTELQEVFQKDKSLGTFNYDLIRTDGPDNDRVFTVRLVFMSGESFIGEGRSKKEAENQAAKMALERKENGKK